MATKFLDCGGDATYLSTVTTSGGFYTISSGTAIVTDIVHGNHIKSIKFVGGAEYLITQDGVLADAGSRVSHYFYLVALPTAAKRTILQATTAGAATKSWALYVTSAGVLQLWRGAGTAQIGSNGPTLSTGQWYKISVAYTITSSTINRFNVFVDQAIAISVTNSSSIQINTSDLIIGANAADATFDARVSDIYVDDSAALTDPGNIWVTAKRPNANGTANEFTTQVGSGGSGYGTGHSPQVNERALS